MPDSIISDSLRNSVQAKLQQTWINRSPWFDLLNRNKRIQKRAGDRLEVKYTFDDTDGYSFGPDSEIEATSKGEVVTAIYDWGAFARDDKQLGWYQENQGAMGKFDSGTVRDILLTRIDNGKSKFFQNFNTRLWRGAGTPYNGGDGRDFLGVEQFVPDNPAVGSVGGLSRVTYDELRPQQLDGTDGDSGDWDNDCWELLLRLRVACENKPMAWGEQSKPDVCYAPQGAMTDIIKLAYNQNTSVGSRVEDIDNVGGVFVELNDAIQGNRVYLLSSKTWSYYYPEGCESVIELDIRSELEKRMNPKDTVIIWRARGSQICDWAPQNGIITTAA